MPRRLLGRALRGEARSDRRVASRASVYLGASAATTLISFVSLPLATRILGPVNYGVFALGSTIAGFATTLATLGTTFYVGSRFHAGTEDERRIVISTLVLRTTVLSAAWGVVALGTTWALKHHLATLHDLPLRGLAIVLVAGVLTAPWVIAIDVLTVEGQATWFALSLVTQAVANVVTLLASLYLFHYRILALFVGNLGGALAAFVMAVAVLMPYLSLRSGLRPLKQRHFVPMQLLEAAQPLVERSLLANYAGFTVLGRYAHSQSYRSLLVQGTNAMNRSVWPLTLTEARENHRFPITGRAWSVVQLGLALVSAPLVLYGDRLISALTNNKLTGAWVFLAPWCLVVILQSTGKAASGVLYATGVADAVAKIGLTSNAVVVAGFVVLIPLWGVRGAVVAVILQALVYRVVLQTLARRHADVPFQDWGAVLAGALVVCLFAVRRYATDDPATLGIVLAAAEVLTLAVGYRVLREAVSVVLRGRRAPGARVDPVA